MNRIRVAVASPAFVAGFAPGLAVWALTALGIITYYS
jgi:hypothetical protein